MTAEPSLHLNEFLSSGQEEDKSPFLTEETKHWGKLLLLKASIAAAILLCIGYGCTFFSVTTPLVPIALALVYFLVGVPAIIETIEAVTAGHIDIDVLMTLAAFAALGIGSPFEGALLLVLFALSGAMEDTVTFKARGALRHLHHLSPTKALVMLADGTIQERSIKDIAVGSTIFVKAGEVIPLDGDVIAGVSAVNVAHLTGESIPLTKNVGDAVPAGGYAVEGSLTLRVTRSSSDSTLGRMIELITKAQEARPHLQRWLDTATQRYSIGVIAATAILIVILPWIVSNMPYLGPNGSLYRALTFMIAASPCALIIATPVAYLSAISASARQGILLKGGVTLDALAQCKTIAFDKTGTLTTGELQVEKIVLLPTEESELTFTETEALAAAVALEISSSHPIATAVVAHARHHKVAAAPSRNFRSTPGYGIEGVVHLHGKEWNAFIGHAQYICSKLGDDAAQQLQQQLVEHAHSGKVMAILLLGKQVALFCLADTVRPYMQQTLHHLKKDSSLRLLMITGDRHDNAQHVAKQLHLDEFYADLRPEDKLAHVERLSKTSGLIMVGDGVNDAPALARATVGISMGKFGSATAVEVSDVVLLQDNLSMLHWLIDKAKATRRVIIQNISFAGLIILVASTSALFGLVPLWLAVILHEGGTVIVGLNGLRLLRR